MVILGIDPGSKLIGYGLIRKDGGEKFIHLKSGLIKLPENRDGNKILPFLERELEKIIEIGKPKRVGLEKIFFSKNQKTAINVIQARGVIVNTITKNAIPIIEMAPSEVKLATTGYGQATKAEVAKMVRLILHLNKPDLIDDITDALAIALAASNNRWA